MVEDKMPTVQPIRVMAIIEKADMKVLISSTESKFEPKQKKK